MAKSSLFHLTTFLPQTKAEGVTDGVAMASLFSPAWLPPLKEASEAVGYIVPILAATYLVIQIALKLHAAYKGRNT